MKGLKWLDCETYCPSRKDASRNGMFLRHYPHCRQKFSLRSGSFFPEKSFIAKSSGGHHDTYFPSKFLWMSTKNFSMDLSPTEFWWTGLTSVEISCLCLWEDPQLNLAEKEKFLKLMKTNLKRKNNQGKVHNPGFWVLGAVERITNKFVLWIVSRRDSATTDWKKHWERNNDFCRRLQCSLQPWHARLWTPNRKSFRLIVTEDGIHGFWGYLESRF